MRAQCTGPLTTVDDTQQRLMRLSAEGALEAATDQRETAG